MSVFTPRNSQSVAESTTNFTLTDINLKSFLDSSNNISLLYNVAETFDFRFPVGVNKALILLGGGGGNGGAAYAPGNSTNKGGGGGGGGGVSFSIIDVTPDLIYSVTVGGPSGTSSFSNLVTATGGSVGGSAAGSVGIGGAGGIGNISTGGIGGNGSTAYSSYYAYGGGGGACGFIFKNIGGNGATATNVNNGYGGGGGMMGNASGTTPGLGYSNYFTYNQTVTNLTLFNTFCLSGTQDGRGNNHSVSSPLNLLLFGGGSGCDNDFTDTHINGGLCAGGGGGSCAGSITDSPGSGGNGFVLIKY